MTMIQLTDTELQDAHNAFWHAKAQHKGSDAALKAALLAVLIPRSAATERAAQARPAQTTRWKRGHRVLVAGTINAETKEGSGNWWIEFDGGLGLKAIDENAMRPAPPDAYLKHGD